MAELGPMEMAQMMMGLTDNQKMMFQSQYAAVRKDRGTALILAFFWYDRFWLNDAGLGVLKVLTLGGCLIWSFIDLFTAFSRTDSYNRKKADEILMALRMSSGSSTYTP